MILLLGRLSTLSAFSPSLSPNSVAASELLKVSTVDNDVRVYTCYLQACYKCVLFCIKWLFALSTVSCDTVPLPSLLRAGFIFSRFKSSDIKVTPQTRGCRLQTCAKETQGWARESSPMCLISDPRLLLTRARHEVESCLCMHARTVPRVYACNTSDTAPAAFHCVRGLTQWCA